MLESSVIDMICHVSIMICQPSSTIIPAEHHSRARQVQKDALQRDYSNIKYEQPYQTAMYNQSVLCEAKRWHVHSYEEAITDLTPKDLQVTPPPCDRCQLTLH